MPNRGYEAISDAAKPRGRSARPLAGISVNERRIAADWIGRTVARLPELVRQNEEWLLTHPGDRESVNQNHYWRDSIAYVTVLRANLTGGDSSSPVAIAAVEDESSAAVPRLAALSPLVREKLARWIEGTVQRLPELIARETLHLRAHPDDDPARNQRRYWRNCVSYAKFLSGRLRAGHQ